jgi:hypothetical protein
LKPLRLLKFGVAFLVLPAALALSPLMVREVDRKVEELSRKNRHDLSAFTLRDRLGIYGLNIVMGLVAYPLYPEASRETLLLLFPSPLARRLFHSEFALGSRKVRAQLREFRQRLARGDTAAAQMRIVWDASEYRLTEPEARFALALNQTWLWLNARQTRNGWFIDVRHDVGIEYPDSAYVTLISRPRLRIEEGLFWVLQNCGWLHPYTAEWRFTVPAEDRRLD